MIQDYAVAARHKNNLRQVGKIGSVGRRNSNMIVIVMSPTYFNDMEEIQVWVNIEYSSYREGFTCLDRCVGIKFESEIEQI